MLAVAHQTDNDWKSSQTLNNSRPSLATTPSMTSRDQSAQYNASSTPMTAASSSASTVMPRSGSIDSSQTNGKGLARSKSRGASVGVFVHGLVNGVHAGMNGLRNVGHKPAPSAATNGYHSEYTPSRAALFKSKSPPRASILGSSEEASSPTRLRDQPSPVPVRALQRGLSRSTSRSRAYESEGEGRANGAVRQPRPRHPPVTTSFVAAEASNVHTHIPLSPTSPLSPSKTTPISTPITTPSTPPLPSHIVTGPVPQTAARAVLELDAIPPTELLKVLAALLEQIAAANDALQAERKARGEIDQWNENSDNLDVNGKDTNPSPVSPSSTPIWDTLTTASRIALSNRNTTLSFHARHIPQISLEAYLMRILKYCPTANATFVAVLVYFDRMCRMAGGVDGERESLGITAGQPFINADDGRPPVPQKWKGKANFAIDSFNIHRLVIAGVTVASKFFSDVLYTNSRYAKVGGLPQSELNQLELQFLLLNDFALVIPPEELARYAAQLIAYAQSRGISLAPQGLGTGSLSREAKVILGVDVPEFEPDPFPFDTTAWRNSDSLQNHPYAYSGVSGPTANPIPFAGSRQSNGSLFSNSTTESFETAPDSEAEVSTDEDSTIRARSGSESEASEWSAGTDDGAETETEGEDDDHDDFNNGPRRLPVAGPGRGIQSHRPGDIR